MAAANLAHALYGCVECGMGVDMAGCGGYEAMGPGQLGSYKVNCVVCRMGAHAYNLGRDCTLGR